MKYKPTWELDTIPEPEFNSEHGRRNAAKRKVKAGGHSGGRKPSCICGVCATCKRRKKRQESKVNDYSPRIF